MPIYYTLAKGSKPLPLSNNFPWPYEIALCFDAVPHPVGFAEGVGAGQGSGHFSAQDALTATWQDHFTWTGGDWLRPFIERLAAGERLDGAALLAGYRSRHGGEPEQYLSRTENS